MFTFQYAANPELSWQGQHLRGLIEIFDHRKKGIRLYSERMVQALSRTRPPKIQKLLEQGYNSEKLRPLTEEDLIIHGG